jgi:F-type H+-transporting ATPase subunit epsilon
MALELQCTVVTPDRTVRDGPADFVALTLSDGEIGIAPGRTPLIARLGYGELRIKADTRLERYYVEGGFVEVAGDVVSVLTPRAVAAEAIDEEEAREQLMDARAREANTPELRAQRDRAIEKARGRLRAARRARQA